MRRTAARLLVLALALEAGCSTSGAPSSPAAQPERDAVRIEVPHSGRSVRLTRSATVDDLLEVVWEDCFPEMQGLSFGNLQRDEEDGAVKAGERLGTRAPTPELRSKAFETELRRSEASYREGRYLEAAEALRPAIESQSYDAFVAQAYARALYRVPDRRGDSFRVYRDLVGALDAFGSTHAADHVYVDVWFHEAYWKLGTLYLDLGDPRAAICEIGRSLFGRSQAAEAANAAYFEQAYGYLAEAYSGLGRSEAADRFAREVLRLDPANTSVRPYLAEE
jgi:tetratricopeptide (TPR) repeat protein